MDSLRWHEFGFWLRPHIFKSAGVPRESCHVSSPQPITSLSWAPTVVLALANSSLPDPSQAKEELTWSLRFAHKSQPTQHFITFIFVLLSS